jgi:hypothetical protein
MTSELFQIIKEYADFETEVRPWMAKLCGPHCSVCEIVCCRPEYCRESIDSPFLALLRTKYPPQTKYTAERGWLTPNGCALACGRPPVCYQFNCLKITAALPDDSHRHLMKVLSNLVSHAGKRALAARHVVEIMDAAGLARIKITRFHKRLNEARKALEVIQAFEIYGCLPASSRAVLSKIAPVPPTTFSNPTKSESNFAQKKLTRT